MSHETGATILDGRGRPELLSGNRLLAEGALEAGCRFFSGYPITPSSEIYETMMKELPARNGLALAAPDEITALALCVGASLRGFKAMTATSGPGWCLMIETVQYAVMTETPVVVAIVQRLGPSTGGATQGAQGDVLLAEFCTSGGYTLPMFAPGTARQCYEVAQAAFHWSERLRTPAVILSDKEVGMTLESLDPSSLAKLPRTDRTPYQGDSGRFRTFASDCPEEPPPFAPVGGDARIVLTGSAHDRAGRLRKNSDEVIEVLTRLQQKIASHAGQMALFADEPADGADTLVVSYGISARAALAACRQLRAAGRRVSFLQLLTLFPVPADAIRRTADGCARVLVVEENLTGLYASILEPLLGAERLVRVNRIGQMITPADVVKAAEAA